MSVATNQMYYNAFNDYLRTNNLEQAETDGVIRGDMQVYPVDSDMFFGFLVNKIVLTVINGHSFIDKLDKFYKDGYMLAGQRIEDTATVLKSKLYNYDTKNFEVDVENPYKKCKKGLQVCYHTKSDYKKITVTVSWEQLSNGFMTEGGIDALVNQMVNDVSVEYSAWAYDAKKKVLTKRDYAQVITFKDYADFNLKLKGVKIDVTNFDNSYKHNASLLLRPTSESNLAIIMSERFKNDVDINVFTGLFNVSYAELKDRITYIDEFDDPDVVCGIYDTRGFQFRKVLDRARELPNGSDLTVNRFTHFWRMHSVSPLYTAIVFKKESENTFNDIGEIVKGYDEENKKFVTSTTIKAQFNGKYRIGFGTLKDMTEGQEITITNPKQLSPVAITMYKYDGEKEIGSLIYRVRFEYPSEIDATLGHPMEIK